MDGVWVKTVPRENESTRETFLYCEGGQTLEQTF